MYSPINLHHLLVQLFDLSFETSVRAFGKDR